MKKKHKNLKKEHKSISQQEQKFININTQLLRSLLNNLLF